MDKRCNTSVFLPLAVIVMQVLFGARAASAQDIPQPLLEYIATLATYKNASFVFECYQDTTSDPSSERIKIGFGTIWLEFDKIAFKEDVMLSDLKGFSSHRLSSHVDGVTTRITENVNKPDSRYVSIGAKDPRPCPYNMLGLGFASSYNLALDPENLRSLADFLIEGAHMGIREIESNSYEIISLGSKKRYSGPWRMDVMIRLDPERRFLPKSIEFRGRSFDDHAADYPLFKYEISEWTTVNGVDFPTVVLETAERVRWVIQKESLQVNDAKFAVDHQLDLTGIRGFDERTNTHINQKVLSPEEKEELERFRQEADASTSIDRASMARINTPAWKNPRVYTMVAASLLIVLGIAWSVARYRRGLGILVLFGNALLLSGCEVRHHHADDGIQTKNALQQLDPGPIVIDYGKDLFVNTRQSARVSFQNVSSKPVQWIDMTTSCGCSKAKWSQETVQPGETVMLVADIDIHSYKSIDPINGRKDFRCGIARSREDPRGGLRGCLFGKRGAERRVVAEDPIC